MSISAYNCKFIKHEEYRDYSGTHFVDFDGLRLVMDAAEVRKLYDALQAHYGAQDFVPAGWAYHEG